ALNRAPALTPGGVIGPNASLRQIAIDSDTRSEEHTSELQSLTNLVCRLLLEKKKIVYIVRKSYTTLCSFAIIITPSGCGKTAQERNQLFSGSFFFFNDTATTEIYTLSLHDALSISLTSCPSLCWASICSGAMAAALSSPG